MLVFLCNKGIKYSIEAMVCFIMEIDYENLPEFYNNYKMTYRHIDVCKRLSHKHKENMEPLNNTKGLFGSLDGKGGVSFERKK